MNETQSPDLTVAEIAGAMKRYGGEFVSRLGHALEVADTLNRERIRTAFPGEWATYCAFAMNDREEGGAA